MALHLGHTVFWNLQYRYPSGELPGRKRAHFPTSDLSLLYYSYIFEKFSSQKNFVKDHFEELLIKLAQSEGKCLPPVE